MTQVTLVWMLTALAAVVVLLTRSRLIAQERQSGVTETPRLLLNIHTGSGVLAIVAWAVWLSGGPGWVGIVALVFWWALTVDGLLILARWLPSHGTHSTDAADDDWAHGPWLSVLGHIGMLLGVGFFTWFYFAGNL